jgi:hypothetical protein
MPLAEKVLRHHRFNRSEGHPRAAAGRLRPSVLSVMRMILAFTAVGVGAAGALGRDEPARGDVRPPRLLVFVEDKLVKIPIRDRVQGLFLVDPATGKLAQACDPGLVDGALAPGGRHLAAGRAAADGPDRFGVWVYDLSGEEPPRRVFPRPFFTCCWTGEGKQLVISAPAGRAKFETYRLNADGTGEVKLPVPEGEYVWDSSRDGAWLATIEVGGGQERRARIHLMHPDGTGRHAVLDEPDKLVRSVTFSPDGRKLVYALMEGERRKEKVALWIVDADGKNRKQVPVEFVPGTFVRQRWSPDGTQLAMSLSVAGAPGRDDRVVVVDIDGKNLRAIPLPPGRLELLDWK